MIMKANNPASEFCGCVWFVMCIVTCFKDHDRMPVRSNMVAKLKRTDLFFHFVFTVVFYQAVRCCMQIHAQPSLLLRRLHLVADAARRHDEG